MEIEGPNCSASVRKGKEAAQSVAVGVAKGRFWCFDVATILAEHACRNIVKNFMIQL